MVLFGYGTTYVRTIIIMFLVIFVAVAAHMHLSSLLQKIKTEVHFFNFFGDITLHLYK